MLEGKRFVSISLVSLMVLTGLFSFLSISEEESIFNISITASGSFAGGDGTLSNPYQISNVTQLQDMISNLSAHYVLINNIDANDTEEWNWNGTVYNGFVPVGNDTDRFTGSLNGNDHTIFGLHINRSSEYHVGLIGYYDSIFRISNITIRGSNISGLYKVGTLIGEMEKGEIYNVDVETKVRGILRFVGGMIGKGVGSIIECSSECYLNNSDSTTGGLVGSFWGRMERCSSKGRIVSYNMAGGLVGDFAGDISNSTSSITVTVDSYNSGGIVGRMSSSSSDPSTIFNCTSVGDVNGFRESGGLVGRMDHDSMIINSTASGNVNAPYDRAGGLVGYSYGSIKNSYATGDVVCGSESGGLLGNGVFSNIENSFYCVNYTMINGEQVLTPFGIYSNQFNEWLDNGKSLDIDDHLNKDPISGKYMITGQESLKLSLPFLSQKHSFIQMLDMDLSTEHDLFIPIFYGVEYDGNGCIVSNLEFTSSINTYEGFIGSIGKNSIVKDLTIRDSTPSFKGTFGAIAGYNQGEIYDCRSDGSLVSNYTIGGIVGSNQGSISNCVSTCDITGYRYVGGIVGTSSRWSSISRSFSTGAIQGRSYIGGIIGENNGQIEHCKATGDISGYSSIGGLVGSNDGAVSISCSFGDVSGNNTIGGFIGYQHGEVVNCFSRGNVTGYAYVGGFSGRIYDDTYVCYSTGKVMGNFSAGGFNGYVSVYYQNRIGGCFFDRETSGLTTSSGGLGLSTMEMKSDSTYVDAYWNLDFIWHKELFDYPKLGFFIVNHLITNMKQMEMIRYDPEGSYSLENDIDAVGTFNWDSGKGYRPASLRGEFKGNGYNITNLNINRPDENYMGVFSGLTSGGHLTNLNIIDARITGYCNIGGLVGGYSGGLIENCTFSGMVDGYKNINGLFGDFNNNLYPEHGKDMKNTYYNINKTSIKGKYKQTMFGIYDDQFQDRMKNGLIDINDYLARDEDTGSYVISSERDLLHILPFYDRPYNYIQINDLDLSNEKGFYIPFWKDSIYDGRGHVIKGIDVDQTFHEAIGTFGLINENSEVRNLHIMDCNITCSNYGGGLAGRNYGLISNCSTGGDLLVYTEYAGGLVGLNAASGVIKDSYSSVILKYGNKAGGFVGANSGKITRCFSYGKLDSEEIVGGFVGYSSRGNISNCYSTCDVSGDDYYAEVGGFSGVNRLGDIVNCYSTGKVESGGEKGGFVCRNDYGKVVNCFWDTTISQVTESDGGTGLTNSQMKRRSSYEDADWDMNETWLIDDGRSYPFLKVFFKPPALTVEETIHIDEDSELYIHIQAKIFQPPTGENQVSFEIETDCTWLEKDLLRTGILRGTPRNEDVGEWTVEINASDSFGLWTMKIVTIIVDNINDAPQLDPVPFMTIKEDEPFWIELMAYDIDPGEDIFNWSIQTDANFLSIDQSGNLSGIPGNDDLGRYWVKVIVRDEPGLSSSINITLTVVNTNDPPAISGEPITTAIEDDLYVLTLDAVDIDPGPNREVWSLDTNADFLTIDVETGEIMGIPENDDVGSWWVNASVSDERGGFDWMNFTLTVLNINDEPRLNVTSFKVSMDEDSEGKTINLLDIFIDIDGDQLQYDVSGDRNISFTIEDDNITFIPDENWFGLKNFRIKASDEEYSVSIDIEVEVISVNDAPTDVMIFAEDTYIAGWPQMVNSEAEDVDIPFGDSLKFYWSSNATGEIGEGKTINLSLPPGKHLVTLKVIDYGGLSANSSKEIEILTHNVEDVKEPREEKKEFPVFILVILVVILVAVLAGILVFVLVRSRKKTDGLPPPEEKKEDTLGEYIDSIETPATTAYQPVGLDIPIEQQPSIPEEPGMMQGSEQMPAQEQSLDINERTNEGYDQIQEEPQENAPDSGNEDPPEPVDDSWMNEFMSSPPAEGEVPTEKDNTTV